MLGEKLWNLVAKFIEVNGEVATIKQKTFDIDSNVFGDDEFKYVTITGKVNYYFELQKMKNYNYDNKFDYFCVEPNDDCDYISISQLIDLFESIL